MRHRINGKKLSLDHDQRKALFKNLINSLILHGQIKTTEAKAKAVRRLAEKLITKGKEQTLHARRLIAAFLQNKKAVNKIVDELAPLFKKRPGGYTRIVRLGERRGDNAPIVRLELVEKPEKEKTEKVVKKPDSKKTTPKR
jgi:large subunit ribosomal protein L17